MRTSVTKDRQRHRGSGTSSTGCQPADAPGSSLARRARGPVTVGDQRMTTPTVTQRSVAAAAVGEQIGATDIVTERGDDGGGQDQGPHRWARGALGGRGGRHPGVDAAGHPVHPAGWARRLRRRRPRGRAARHRAVLLPCAPARRARAGAPLPARVGRADLEPPDRPGPGVRLELPLEEAAEGYRAMDERHAIKTLLRP
jgi:hypothetical protein